MKKQIFPLLISVMILLSCSKKDDDTSSISPQTSTDQLIFGHYYGMCAGEECVEIFKLTKNELQEDGLDNYGGIGPFNFVKLEDKKFNLVKDLMNTLPAALINMKDSTFGCPDCADQGGLYISYTANKVVKTWRIDQSKSVVPNDLHTFMDSVNAKIRVLNQ